MRIAANKTKSRKSQTLGFSIIEATIGLGSVATVVLALYSAVISAFGGIQMSRENLRASQILVDKMDAIRLLSWDQITTPNFVPAQFTEAFDPVGVKNGTGAGLTYQGKVNIENGPSDVSYGSDLKKVTVKIAWKSASGMTRSRQFQTFVTRNGLQSYIY